MSPATTVVGIQESCETTLTMVSNPYTGWYQAGLSILDAADAPQHKTYLQSFKEQTPKLVPLLLPERCLSRKSISSFSGGYVTNLHTYKNTNIQIV